MKTFAQTLLLLLLAGMACNNTRPSRIITIEFTAPGSSELDFTGRFGKHDQWEKVEGTTPKEYDFDLNEWPDCYCLHRLVVRKTTAGTDTLRVRTYCHGEVVSDTFATTEDSLDYWPYSP
jgi:hypothetical protein